MKYLKVFENYQSDEEIISICNKLGIDNYTIENGLVNVNGNVNIAGKLSSITSNLPIRFGVVTGYFDISDNRLLSLEGCPEIVGDGFYCTHNMLTSLEFCPKKVEFGFYCNNNRLTSLEGVGYIGGDFYCDNNKLVSLIFGPKKVLGTYNCEFNEISTLVGGPESIDGNFYCDSNKLESLDGCPDVGDDFHFSNNNIYELIEVAKVGGSIYCINNPIGNIWGYLFADMEHIELFNYFDPIRPPEKEVLNRSFYPDLPIIYLSVLNAFLEQIGEDGVKEVKGYKCL
jgi:hypothetical protein